MHKVWLHKTKQPANSIVKILEQLKCGKEWLSEKKWWQWEKKLLSSRSSLIHSWRRSNSPMNGNSKLRDKSGKKRPNSTKGPKINLSVNTRLNLQMRGRSMSSYIKTMLSDSKNCIPGSWPENPKLTKWKLKSTNPFAKWKIRSQDKKLAKARINNLFKSKQKNVNYKLSTRK